MEQSISPQKNFQPELHSNKQAHWLNNMTTWRQAQLISYHSATSMVKYKVIVPVYITNSFPAAAEISDESVTIVLKCVVKFTQRRTQYSSLPGINPHHVEIFSSHL